MYVVTYYLHFVLSSYFFFETKNFTGKYPRGRKGLV